MPVGTKATVKTLHPDEVRELGAQILLGNTYHLHFRPGRRADRASSAACTASWAGTAPILTDSGGFQVFSLRDTLARRRRRRRHVPQRLRRRRGALHARARGAIQREPRQRHRDVPRPGAAAGRRRGASSRTPCGGRRSGRAASGTPPRAEGQLRFGISQGGIDPELRRRSTEEIAELDFDGNAIGGLAIGEDRGAMFETTDWVGGAAARRQAALLHGHRRPRGDPRGDRGRRRHVRLRAADAHRPHRQRAHAGRAG